VTQVRVYAQATRRACSILRSIKWTPPPRPPPDGKIDFAPPTNLRAINAVEIAFTAGYGSASAVPQPIKQAILQSLPTSMQIAATRRRSSRPRLRPHWRLTGFSNCDR